MLAYSLLNYASSVWLRPEVVAHDALDAVEQGRLTSVPGAHWRVLSELVNLLPHQLVRSLTTKFDGPEVPAPVS